MRRIFAFLALAASLILAPTLAVAQNVSNPTSTDKVLIDRVDASGIGTRGAVLVNQLFNGTGMGYLAGYGAGCAVTQITTRATGVTCTGYTGQLTLLSAAGSATATSFTVTDTSVVASDTIIVSQKSGTNLYEIFVTAVGAGSFQITQFTTGGTTTEAPVFNFAVVHAAAS